MNVYICFFFFLFKKRVLSLSAKYVGFGITRVVLVGSSRNLSLCRCRVLIGVLISYLDYRRTSRVNECIINFGGKNTKQRLRASRTITLQKERRCRKGKREGIDEG